MCNLFAVCVFRGFACLPYPLCFACFPSFFAVSLDRAASDSRLGESSIACWWAGLPSFARLNQDGLPVWKRRARCGPLLLTFPSFSLIWDIFPSQTLFSYILNAGYFLSFIFHLSARNITVLLSCQFVFLPFFFFLIDFTLCFFS